jgi:hypothetical protein
MSGVSRRSMGNDVIWWPAFVGYLRETVRFG